MIESTSINRSEQLFECYLQENGIRFIRNHVVNESNDRNVDFCINFDQQKVLADVKEVRDIPRYNKEIVAYKQIREDVKKLRQKFGKSTLCTPIVLVTVNTSSTPFTGFTVIRAMLGDLGISFFKDNIQQSTPLRHKSQGNAILNPKKNTSISGILVFRPPLIHAFFANPFAIYPMDNQLFPNTEYFFPMKEDSGQKILQYSKLMF